MVLGTLFKVDNKGGCSQMTQPVDAEKTNALLANGYMNGNCSEWGYPYETKASSVWYKNKH